MLISVVINCDTRGQKNEQTGLFGGVVNSEFLTQGVFNKLKFFAGFEIELIVFVDEHNAVPDETIAYLRTLASTVVIRRHTSEEKFNDYNYLAALSLCRGEIIVHFDQDIAAFTSSPDQVQEMIDLLEHYDFVSYPCQFSPNPDVNDNYDYWWCSTRYFMCKRESLDLTEIRKCLQDMDYLYEKYPASVKNPWFEHCLGLHAKYNGKKKGVYYPPPSDKLLIWCWDNYESYILTRLNSQPYNEVLDFVIQNNGIFYPNNLRVTI